MTYPEKRRSPVAPTSANGEPAGSGRPFVVPGIPLAIGCRPERGHLPELPELHRFGIHRAGHFLGSSGVIITGAFGRGLPGTGTMACHGSWYINTSARSRTIRAARSPA